MTDDAARLEEVKVMLGECDMTLRRHRAGHAARPEARVPAHSAREYAAGIPLRQQGYRMRGGRIMAGIDMLLESALRNLTDVLKEGDRDLTRIEIGTLQDARTNIRIVMKSRADKRRNSSTTRLNLFPGPDVDEPPPPMNVDPEGNSQWYKRSEVMISVMPCTRELLRSLAAAEGRHMNIGRPAGVAAIR